MLIKLKEKMFIKKLISKSFINCMIFLLNNLKVMENKIIKLNSMRKLINNNKINKNKPKLLIITIITTFTHLLTA